MSQILTPSGRSLTDFFAVARRVYDGDPGYAAPSHTDRLYRYEGDA